MKNKHLGSDFDDFLREQDMLAGAEAVAAKRVLAFQLEKEMRRKGLTKVEMATRMRTSRRYPGVNVNVLHDDQVRDRFCGMPVYNGTPCRVEAVERRREAR